MYEIGIDTVERVSRADAVDLHLRINQINKEGTYFKGQFDLNDIKIVVDAA